MLFRTVSFRECRRVQALYIREDYDIGDKVLPKDLKYLMDTDSASYKLAMVNQKPKEHPEEWDSVLVEEDRRNRGVSMEAVSSSEDSAPI